jgi:hypothetical protein
MVESFKKQEEAERPAETTKKIHTAQLLVEAELAKKCRELEKHEQAAQYQRSHYSVSTLSPDVVRMETGLPTKEVFDIVVMHALRYKGSTVYFAGWKVESISFEDQIFITLMKDRQNYTNIHLAQLFSCSVATIYNIVTTFYFVLHKMLFKDIMTTIPSREKNMALAVLLLIALILIIIIFMHSLPTICIQSTP